MGLFSKSPQKKYEAGMDAKGERNYKKAFRLLEEAAAAGHLEAQYQCGYLYACGPDATVNFSKAMEYFLKAAEQGHLEAQYQCGELYRTGQGINRNLKKALYWYEKAAEQGNISALERCAELYSDPKKKEIYDLSKAFCWAQRYEKASPSQYASGLYRKIRRDLALKTDDKEELFAVGLEFFKVGAYDNAKQLLKKASDRKHVKAQYYYGLILHKGLGLDHPEPKKAWELFRKAAASGLAEAQYMLGDLYYRGEAKESADDDCEKALEWFQKAAEQGHAEAQFRCSEMYRFGIGTEENPKAAREWREKAAAQGYKNAAESLEPVTAGAKLSYDYGCKYDFAAEPDLGKARYWYERAARMGHLKAQSQIAVQYFLGHGGRKDYKRALYWYEKVGAYDDYSAQKNVSELYFEGKGTQRNVSMALYWVERARENGLLYYSDYLEKVHAALSELSPEERKAELDAMFSTAADDLSAEDYAKAVPMLKWLENQGRESAKYLLSSARLKGLLFHDSAIEAYNSKDYAQALIDFEKAAFTGHTESQYNCGIMYYNGQGTEKYYEKAFYWYRKAAEQGHANAQNNLGYLYDFGQGTLRSPSEALRWYEKAAEQGLAMAQYNCGLMYLDGRATKQDKTKARVLLKKASDQGYTEASKVLAERF